MGEQGKDTEVTFPPDRWHAEWLRAVELLDELEAIVSGHVEMGHALDAFSAQPQRKYLNECGRR